jgi:hypothetical protein
MQLEDSEARCARKRAEKAFDVTDICFSLRAVCCAGSDEDLARAASFKMK